MMQRYIMSEVAEKAVEKGLRTEEMVLNMGPQHPSTHGVLRLELVLDGEIIVDVIPHIGYLHRCFEKHAEAMTYPQVIPYCDRMDYVASMSMDFGYVVAMERLMGIKVPERVEYIRVLMAELQRIASHLIAIGTYGIEMGAFTPFLYCFRERERILDLFEITCGARLLYNYMWIGGLSHDIPQGFVEKAKDFCEYFKPKIKEYNDLLSYNKILQNEPLRLAFFLLTWQSTTVYRVRFSADQASSGTCERTTLIRSMIDLILMSRLG